MRGLGANFFLDSQNGKINKQTTPMTSMVMTVPDLQPLETFGAMVIGIKISENAALRNMIPPMSSSDQRFSRILLNGSPAQGRGAVNPSFFAFLLFKNKVMARGENITGKMIHQTP